MFFLLIECVCVSVCIEFCINECVYVVICMGFCAVNARGCFYASVCARSYFINFWNAWIYIPLYVMFEFVYKSCCLSLDFNFCPRFICRVDKYIQGRSNCLCLRTIVHSEYFSFIPQQLF